MALDLTTTKQDGIAYDSAVELTISAGTTSIKLPTKMKAFKIHPTTASALIMNFQSSQMTLILDADDDDGKIIPLRPESIFCSAELTIEMLF